MAVSELNGKISMTMNLRSDRIYYFIEGNAIFHFENETIKIEVNSSLFIPKNTKYKMSGSFKAILINSPVFNINDEKIFK